MRAPHRVRDRSPPVDGAPRRSNHHHRARPHHRGRDARRTDVLDRFLRPPALPASGAPMTAVRKVVEFPDRRQRRRDYETAFLPATLEVIEPPPSPIGRATGATIIAVFCIAVIWASLGKVDMVATAPGKIVPSDRTKTVQPFEAGVVRAIRVRDGASVNAGDVMIELDPTISASDVEHARSALVGAELDVARLRAALAGPTDSVAGFTPPAGAHKGLVETHRRFLATPTSEHQARDAEIDRQLRPQVSERGPITGR